jgi:hypothetical protein
LRPAAAAFTQHEFSNDGSWYLVGLGAVAIVVTLILPRGLRGVGLERFQLRVVPVGHTLQGLLTSSAAPANSEKRGQ